MADEAGDSGEAHGEGSGDVAGGCLGVGCDVEDSDEVVVAAGELLEVSERGEQGARWLWKTVWRTRVRAERISRPGSMPTP